MTRRNKQVFVVLALVALLAFAAWPTYSKWRTVKAVSASLEQRTRTLVEKNPQLKPAWDNAMQDGVLTWAEAKQIVESAGETVQPDE
jgi:hypothetical protein